MDLVQVEQLMSVAIGTARLLGFTIAEGCQGHLRSHLQQSSLTAAPASKSDPGGLFPVDTTTKILLAQTRVAQFTAAMAEDALRSGPPADMMLHEFNFFAVKNWVCPLWPVC